MIGKLEARLCPEFHPSLVSFQESVVCLRDFLKLGAILGHSAFLEFLTFEELFYEVELYVFVPQHVVFCAFVFLVFALALAAL